MLTTNEIIEREFLEMRSELLKLAASFDRIERSGGELTVHPKTARLLEAVDLIRDGDGDRAERIQLLFSKPYDPDWQK